MPWHELRDFVRYAPRDSAIARSIHGEVADWTLPVQLLARTVDILAAANWQRGGGKGTKPRPIPRPDSTRRIGSGSMSLDEMDAFLGYSPRK